MAELKALLCPGCGGQLQDFKQGIACCPYCGTNVKELVDNYYVSINNQYNIDNATIVYDSSIEVKTGLDNAKVYLDLHNDYIKAKNVLDSIERYSANIPEFWWLSTRQVTKDFTDLSDESINISYDLMLKFKKTIDSSIDSKTCLEKYRDYLNKKQSLLIKQKNDADAVIKNNNDIIEKKDKIKKDIKTNKVFTIVVPIVTILFSSFCFCSGVSYDVLMNNSENTSLLGYSVAMLCPIIFIIIGIIVWSCLLIVDSKLKKEDAKITDDIIYEANESNSSEAHKRKLIDRMYEFTEKCLNLCE